MPGQLFPFGSMVLLAIIVVGFYIIASSVRILREYERGVIFRLGKLAKSIFNPGGAGNGPGILLLIPLIDRMVKVSLQTEVFDVPSQDIITKDNVSIKVNAVVYFRAMDPEKAVVQVQDYRYATSQIAQTTLRSVLGQSELDELLAERERINQKLQQIIDDHTEPWGVKVSAVEVKQVDLPPEMQRAIAIQAQAERERRAKIIHAEGELQASEKLAQAARMLASEPISVQLRYLQTLTEIGSEKNSTVIFPIPVDIISAFVNRGK
ncbi:MAG: slipin family protein [candidate division NC10 bacterium]|nr:slipin family protein [candidate division NC10 bacterium]